MNNKRGNEERTNVGGNYDGVYHMQDKWSTSGPTFIPVSLAT
jgi:hypothetical protein